MKGIRKMLGLRAPDTTKVLLTRDRPQPSVSRSLFSERDSSSVFSCGFPRLCSSTRSVEDLRSGPLSPQMTLTIWICRQDDYHPRFSNTSDSSR